MIYFLIKKNAFPRALFRDRTHMHNAEGQMNTRKVVSDNVVAVVRTQLQNNNTPRVISHMIREYATIESKPTPNQVKKTDFTVKWYT